MKQGTGLAVGALIGALVAGGILTIDRVVALACARGRPVDLVALDGVAADFDAIAETTSDDWSWKHIGAAYKALESHELGAAETRGDRGGERLNFRFVQYVTAPGEHLAFWIFVLQCCIGAGQTIRVAAAKGDLRPFA